MQDHSYPDPEQLKTYALEPMPFHDIVASDLEIIGDEDGVVDGTLRVGYGDTEYRYRPGDIFVETSREEWEHIDDVDYYDMNHSHAFENAINFQIEEDFVRVTEFVTDNEGEPAQFDAYWVLETVTIRND